MSLNPISLGVATCGWGLFGFSKWSASDGLVDEAPVVVLPGAALIGHFHVPHSPPSEGLKAPGGVKLIAGPEPGLLKAPAG